MRNLNNKTVLAIVATVLVAGTAFFTSCDKEETINNEQIRTKSTTASENLYLGCVKNGEIIYSFSVDDLSTVLYEQTGIYTLEKFEILDSTLTGGIVEVYAVLYNTQEEVTESVWFQIKKDENKYFLNEELVKVSSDSNTNIRCVSSAICIGSCHKLYKKGTLVGCNCSFLGGCDMERFVIGTVTILENAIISIS